MTQQQTLLTPHDFYRLYSGKEGRYELVEGEVIEEGLRRILDGGIVAAVGSLLLGYVKQHSLDWVGVSCGFVLGPATVRAPAVAFVRRERVPSKERRKAFFNGPPDLAVEVVSPSDTASEVEAKVHDYLRSGVSQVWVVYPDGRRVHVFTEDGASMQYEEEDTLTGGDLLPGFSVPVREFFDN